MHRHFFARLGVWVFALSIVLPASAFAQTGTGSEGLEILLTNDDGYQTPAIQTLRAALIAAGHHVVMVAPDGNRSGSSASITLGAINVQTIEEDVYAISGSPATAVLLGAANFFPEGGPDLVISGPNEGANLGPATNISGTVGATIAAISPIGPGVPGIAVSTDLIDASNPAAAVNQALYERIGSFMVRLVDRLVRTARGGRLLPEGIALNVNYPPVEPQGVRLSVQGQGATFRLAYSEVAPGVFAPAAGAAEPVEDVFGSDVTAYEDGFVTIVPIDGDYTAGWQRFVPLHVRLRQLNP